MSTNKKFRIQNGVDIIGEMTFNNQPVINNDGTVVAAAVSPAISSLVNTDYVNGLNVTAFDAITAQTVTNISTFSTTDISEGANLYFTSARARASVQGGTGVSYDGVTGEFSIGQDVGTDADVTFNTVSASVLGTVSSLANHTTDSLGEGTTNKYFTDARVHAALSDDGHGVKVVDGKVSLDYANMQGDLVPSVDNVYSLGSPDKVWRDLYIGPGSLYINGTKILEDNSGTITMYADPGQNLAFGVTEGGSIDFNAGPSTIDFKSDMVMLPGKTISTSGGNATQFGGDVDMMGHSVTNVGAPVADADAATKGYVDGRIAEGTIAGDKTFSNNVTVAGNLVVQGTTTTVNSETISLADNIIDLNSNVVSGAPVENAGIRVMRGDEAAVQVRWNEANDYWETYDGSAWTKIALSTSDLVEGSNLYFTSARVDAIVDPQFTAVNAAVVSGDAAVQASVDAEAARATAAEGVLQGNIDDEATARSAADSQLASDLSAESTARSTADATLQANIDAEAVARDQRDNSLQNNIDVETGLRIAGDSDLLAGLNAEISRAQSAEAALATSIATETVNREAGDTGLQTQLTTLEGRLDAIVAGASANIDTFVEIVNAFETADSGLQSVLTDNSTRLTTAEGKVAVLEGEMDAVQIKSNANETLLANHGPRISSAETGISELNSFTGKGTSLSTMAGNLAAAVNELWSDVQSLEGNLASESGQRQAADTALQAGVDANSAAIAQNTSDISSMDTAYKAADAALQTAINNEISARQTADNDLQTQINNILNNTDATALNSLAEIVTAFQNADNTLSGTLADHSIRIGNIEGWTTDDVPEGLNNLYFTDQRAKDCLVGGLCITYDNVTGTIAIDETEAASSLHVASCTIADNSSTLDGQSGTYYRINVYRVDGTLVN